VTPRLTLYADRHGKSRLKVPKFFRGDAAFASPKLCGRDHCGGHPSQVIDSQDACDLCQQAVQQPKIAIGDPMRMTQPFCVPEIVQPRIRLVVSNHSFNASPTNRTCATRDPKKWSDGRRKKKLASKQR